jgi:hypothetical protein
VVKVSAVYRNAPKIFAGEVDYVLTKISIRGLWFGVLGLLVLSLLGLIGTSPLLAQGAALNLTFGPGRDATQPGTVTLTPQGDQTVVVINVGPNPAGNNADELAHIHMGVCPGVGAVQYPLTNVVGGKSTTTVNTPLSAVLDGNHSINVHRGTAAPESGIYTACVNLPAGVAGAARTGALPVTGTGGMLSQTASPFAWLALVSLVALTILTVGAAAYRRKA